MALRVEEMFQLVAQELAQSGLGDYLRAGVFLCGGGARIPGIAELAERVFGLPVSLGKASSINGLRSALDQPEFAAAIGLVKCASFKKPGKSERRGLGGGLRQTLNQLLRGE
jgi:cell division protein FtsA